MSFTEQRKSLFRLYLPFLLLAILALIFAKFLTPFSISLIFLTVVFIPGFAISRLLKIDFQKDNLGQFVLWFAIGFVYNLLLCFVAIVCHFYLSQLIWLNLIFSGLLFISAFILDFKNSIENALGFRQYLKLENLIFVFVASLIILVLSVIDQLGTNFTGDPLYHLAILRRAVEGQTLSVANLSHVKDQFHSAYIFPVWHVFLAMLTKLSGTNIFVLFREITTILTLMVFVVWYWFFLKILPHRNVAILAIFLFILYYFQTNAYLYTRMAVPDTLNNLLLMPLCFALAIKYIFDKAQNYKILAILSLLLAFMGLVHWTQYFYYLSATGIFLIAYIIFKYKDEDFKETIKRILLAIFANMILVIPILLYLQSKATITSNLQAYSNVQKGSNNDRFYKFTPYMQLSLVFLPVILLFFRKYRRLIFLLGIFLVGPLVYNIPFVYHILRQYLSHVFVNRLYSNLGEWPYVIWAIVLGFILVLVDRLIARLSKTIRYFIDGTLGLSFLWLFFVQYKYEVLDGLYEKIFSENTHLWLNANYQWLIPAVTALALVVFFLQKRSEKILDFFSFSDYKNPIAALALTLIIVLFLSVPAQGRLRTYAVKEFTSGKFFVEAKDPTLEIVNPDKFGGMAAIDFIKQNIPPKSVFDTNTFASYTLPTLVDVHMASYTFDPEPTKKYKDLYDRDVPIEKKLTMLKESNIEYLIYQYKPDESQTPYDAYPQYFTKIFDSTAAIYQVNRDRVDEDLCLVDSTCNSNASMD